MLFQDPAQTCCALALPANIIHVREPGHDVGLAYYFASFFVCLCKELRVDHVQLTKKKKKNKKYLLERRGGTNGALSGHYINCQYYLKRDTVIIVGL